MNKIDHRVLHHNNQKIMSKSEYKPSSFEELHVTTMSGLTYFNKKVDYQRLFKYLPISEGKYSLIKTGLPKKINVSQPEENLENKEYTENQLNLKKVPELKLIAKDRNILKISGKKKAEIINLILLSNVQEKTEEEQVNGSLEINPDIQTVKDLIFPDVPGKILTGKCMIDNVTYYSGIIKKYTKAFRNSTTIDISTREKIVNAKIFVTCIHFCGLKNPTMFKEASKLIVDMIKKVQKISDNAEKNKIMTERTIKWIKNNVIWIDKKKLLSLDVTSLNDQQNQSKIISLPSVINKKLSKIIAETKDVNIFINKIPEISEDWSKSFDTEHFLEEDSCTNRLEITKKYLNSDYPNDISVELVDHFKKLIYIRNPKIFHDYLDDFLSFKRICSPDFAIEKLNTSMLNYSFDLKFKPKLAVIAQKFWDNHYSDNYMVNYDNRIHSNLTIIKLYELKPQVDEPEPEHEPEPEYVQITFRIKKRGKATVSGPYEDICKIAYNEFMVIIASYYDEIHVRDNE